MRRAILIDHRNAFCATVETFFKKEGAKIGWELTKDDVCMEQLSIPEDVEVMFLHVARWEEWFEKIAKPGSKLKVVFAMSTSNVEGILSNKDIKKAVDKFKKTTKAEVFPFGCNLNNPEGREGLKKALRKIT